MKTLLEFKEEMEKKSAKIPLGQVVALLGMGGAAGTVAGSAYGNIMAPPQGKHEEFQSEMLAENLENQLKERARRKRVKKMEDLLNGGRKTLRLG